MPLGPIIDTHLHLWDPTLIRYPWLDSNVLLNRPYLLNEFRVATAGLAIESMVFVQCEAEITAFEAEAAWVEELAKQEPRIKGLVAWAPLEKGGAVRADLERLKRYPLLRGIRRIIQFESDLDFCLRPDFIEGVSALSDYDLSFDICVDHRHMSNIVEFATRVPEVSMVLDHIGKPAISEGAMHPWSEHLRELARLPHVYCKISGLATEANHRRWTSDELRRYIDVATEAFGADRVMFGGDWPVALQAIEYRRWIEILDERMAGIDEAAQRQFWRDNAARFYRI